MSPQTSEHRICRFGLYEADLSFGTLKRHGIPLRVQDQPFKVLGYLLEHPDQIISREELRNHLWPEGTFVEFDGSLNTALMKLRAVLNDNAENPRFIETVPKKGYRFIAPVQLVGAESEMAKSPVSVSPGPAPAIAAEPVSPATFPAFTEPNGPARYSSRRLSARASGLLLFLAGVAATTLFIWRLWPLPEPHLAKVTQLTHTGRVAPDSRVVTDGARLYFVSREDGRLALMTTSINGGSVEKLASPFANTAIFDVSPDRTELLIGPYTYEGEQIPLWIWPAHGGAPHRLGDVVASEAVWSPAGDLIAITQGNHLMTVHRDGSGLRELHTFSATPHSLVWSADAKEIRFTLSNRDSAADEMWEVALDSPFLRRILPDATSGRHDTTGAWNNNEKYFLFTGGSNSRLSRVMDSVSNLWALREPRGFFTRTSRQPVELTHGPVSFRNLSETGDSDRIFALGTHPEYQLLRINSATSNYSTILPDAGATDVDVTPDGQWLAYSLRENGALWKSRANGKDRVELTATAPGALSPQWSPDGKEVLFTAFFLHSTPQLYVLPSDGGTPRPILPPDSPGSAESGDWAPDGQRIVFDYFEQGQSDLRILDRAAAKIQSLPNSQQLEQARWSPDGKYIAAISSRTHQIVLYHFDQQKWTVLAEASDPHGMRWSADSNYIYYQELSDAEQSVYRVRLVHSAPEKVFGFGRLLNSMASQCHFTGVAPDGSIYATLDRGGTDVYALDLRLP
jgi:Tol biopolymer transport system component/DNA-binding winged helix-turn-helix (wHTH) protein